MQGGSRAGALWCHRGCATGASCCCLPPPPSKLSAAFHLAATEGSLHEGRGRSSVGQPAATDHKQRRRRPVGTSGNQRANRHTGAAPHQCRGVVLRGCDVRREAVACVRCLCLLGVSRLGSGKAKCRLSCVRPSGAHSPAASRAAQRATVPQAAASAPRPHAQHPPTDGRFGQSHGTAGRPRRWPHVSMPPLLLPCFQNCNVAAAAAERGAPGGRARRHSRAGVPLPQPGHCRRCAAAAASWRAPTHSPTTHLVYRCVGAVGTGRLHD